jgi:RNA polymerase sigma-70 factor (ECF subfamily)
MNRTRREAESKYLEAVEAAIHALCLQQAWKEATTRLLQDYGPEIAAYVRAIGRQDLTDQAYSDFAVDLWVGLQRFEWRCTARGFAFALARRAVQRAYRKELRTRALARTWASETWLREVIERTRSATPHYLKSEVKTRLRALRDRLSEEERSLLILRIDRGMSFSDLAVVLAEEHEDTPEQRKRTEARLRKRFQLLKDKLKRMVVEEGLHERE